MPVASKMALNILGVPLEFFGGMLLVVGLFTRYLAILFAINMLVALWKAKWFPKDPMPKVPFSSQQATGWEFDFILLAGSIALFLSGGGTPSVDWLLLR